MSTAVILFFSLSLPSLLLPLFLHPLGEQYAHVFSCVCFSASISSAFICISKCSHAFSQHKHTNVNNSSNIQVVLLTIVNRFSVSHKCELSLHSLTIASHSNSNPSVLVCLHFVFLFPNFGAQIRNAVQHQRFRNVNVCIFYSSLPIFIFICVSLLNFQKNIFAFIQLSIFLCLHLSMQ